MPDISNLKEEKFILAHNFVGFSPWLLGPMYLGRTSYLQECVVEALFSLLLGRQEAENGGIQEGAMTQLQGHVPVIYFL
jgi:hypothetical protein